ncbi:hypothetical protein MKW92_038612 [Papaver armeniacum]|nr:hypothetical protein MKW92_038612 [Papaver armeniacum]
MMRTRRNVVSSHAKSCEACESNGCGSAKRKRGRSKEGSVTQGPSSVSANFDPTRSSVKRKPRKPPKNGNDANAHATPKKAVKSNKISKNKDDCVKKNFVRANPNYLNTLGNAHSEWCFGAIAELVDNSRDAKATEIKISVEHHYSKNHDKDIPMLSIIDDGHGMAHEDLIAMLSFGCKKPVASDLDRIGKFGIGFKAGAMKLGRDVIVLTQTAETRSVAFLSQSSNEGKDNLELPVVSYRRHGIYMDEDRSVHSEETIAYNLTAIKEFSPFNEYFIGEKLGLFGAKGQGTQIYIWNLEEWGSECHLEWTKYNDDGDSSEEGDILIRSRRARKRPGQFSKQVPLDYSLRSYLEVIFLNPQMKIYVQGSLVKSFPLAKSLNETKIIRGDIMGKPIQLILGRRQKERELMNGGMFLYWRGRLIEAYKRVGGMMHTPDMGRGVIGVADVTEIMRDGNHDLINNTKQGFQESPAYTMLEDWLGDRTDEYWDEHFEQLREKKGKKKAEYKPDNEWVQCEECRKWRILTTDFRTASSSQKWYFCDMPPLRGDCETPEDEFGPGVCFA